LAGSGIPLGLRRNGDVIPPEGFERQLLDRRIETIDELFTIAVRPNDGLVQTAANIARQAGEIVLGDWGCGTANTLWTWGRAVSRTAPLAIGKIGLIGISRYDYSEESRYPATIQACSNGRIRYIVGEATDPDLIADNSVDVSLAYASIMHTDNPIDWVRSMLRATKPGGYTFFETTFQQAREDDFSTYINELKATDHRLSGGHAQITRWPYKLPYKDQVRRSLFRIQKPAE
jgi:ubiquinone/menaquinone biosynthesis C-methylase UbiE